MLCCDIIVKNIFLNKKDQTHGTHRMIFQTNHSYLSESPSMLQITGEKTKDSLYGVSQRNLSEVRKRLIRLHVKTGKAKGEVSNIGC